MQNTQILRPSRLERLASRLHAVHGALCQSALPLFALSSLTAFGIDYAGVIGLHALAAGLGPEGSLIVSVVGARAISSTLNFAINRRFVFQSRARVLPSATGYYVLVAVVLGADYALLRWQTVSLGAPLWSAKIATEAVLFSLSYAVQRRLIFRAHSIERGTGA